VRVKLRELAYARTGDKGDNLNIGVLARDEPAYRTLKERLTAEVVRDYLSPFVEGPAIRYDLPNLGAFNFLLSKALSGGATRSLRFDFMGRSLAEVLLEMELDV
jgi:hypothetical protein